MYCVCPVLAHRWFSYGAPIDMSAYKDDFLSEEDGKAKLAVKRLTRKIELEVKQMTVNSSDW